MPVSHLDLHRLAGDAGLAAEDPGLLDDYLTADAIAFVEWPEAADGGDRDPAAIVELAPCRRRRAARSRSSAQP